MNRKDSALGQKIGRTMNVSLFADRKYSTMRWPV